MTTTLTCPVCQGSNIWNNNQYKQGVFFNCVLCSARLQQIFCPHCSSSNTWIDPPISVEGKICNCLSCARPFQFICCPHCQNINMWSAANYVQGLVYNCFSCTQPFQHVFCAHCHAPNVYPTDASIQGQRLECHLCYKTYQYIQCPLCHEGQIWNDCSYIPGSIVPCWSCKQNYAHMRCPHCEKSSFWRNPQNTMLSFICLYCEKDMCTTFDPKKSVIRRKSIEERDEASSPSDPLNQIQRSLTDMNVSQNRGRTASPSRHANNRLERSKSRDTSSRRRKNSTCSYFAECNEYVKHLGWSTNFFDKKHDRCYCHSCYSNDLPDVLRIADSDHAVPKDWAGFGLGVDPFRGDDLWNTWIVVYHGTTPLAAQSILAHRQFLLPGDRLLDGTKLAIRAGHIPGKNHIYTSPSIRYASLNVYSRVDRFTSPKTDILYKVQIVLQCKQKPGTFSIQGETVGWSDKRICNIIPNDVIEHFSDRRSSVIPYRLLIHLEKA